MLGMGVQPLGQDDPLEEGWQPTPVFLLGQSHHWQRRLVCYGHWGCKELDVTEHARYARASRREHSPANTLILAQ